MQLCRYKPFPDMLLPALASILFAAALRAELEEVRDFPIPGAKENACYDVSALEVEAGRWNTDHLSVAQKEIEAIYLQKHAKRSAKVANPLKHKALRDLGNYKRR